MTKDDFIAWRNTSVTQEFRDVVIKELDLVITDLVNSAGDDPGLDKYRRGIIHGLQWLVDWVPDFIEESDEDGIDGEGTPGPY